MEARQVSGALQTPARDTDSDEKYKSIWEKNSAFKMDPIEVPEESKMFMPLNENIEPFQKRTATYPNKKMPVKATLDKSRKLY